MSTNLLDTFQTIIKSVSDAYALERAYFSSDNIDLDKKTIEGHLLYQPKEEDSKNG